MPKSRTVDKTDQQISDSEDETFHDLLNLRDQNKVIHEYRLKKPQPTVEELATKYKVTTKHISFIITNEQAILKLDKSNDGEEENIEESARLLLRSAQIKFLDMVMYEYLQRALYYSININEEIFKNKTEDVVDCMALMYFKDQTNFVNHFKSLYGIKEIRSQSLLDDIELKEEKPESLDPVDMVRYVQRHKAQYIAAQIKKDKSQTEPKVYRNETRNTSSRSRKNHSPTISYEPSEEDEQHDWEDRTDSEDTNDWEDRNDIKIMKIELSPTRLSVDTMPQRRSPTIKVKTKSIPKPTSDGRMKILQNTNDLEVMEQERCSSVESAEEEFHTMHEPDGNCADNKETLSPIKTEREDNLSIKIEVLSSNYEPMETYEIREPASSQLHGMNIKTETLPATAEIHCPPEEFLPATAEIHCPPEEFLPGSPEIPCPPEEFLTAHTNGPSDNPRKRPPSTVPLREIDTLDEALRSLRALENYALLKENLRAIGLLTQLEDALKKPPKQ